MQRKHVDLDSVSVRRMSTVTGLGHLRINNSVPVPKRINPHGPKETSESYTGKRITTALQVKFI